MSKRKQPFGYSMVRGELVLQTKEAAIIQEIFRQYTLGISFKELTEWLKNQPVPYDEGRLWNKNIVARILADKRYIGVGGWPAIVETELFQSAAAKREAKCCPIRRDAATKVLARLCKGSCGERTEQLLLSLLNRLIEQPELIVHEEKPAPEEFSVAALEYELESVLEENPIDEERANALVRRLAEARYESIENEGYETERLRRLFARVKPLTALDADLLRETVSEIRTQRGHIIVTLKNGQVLKGGKL